MDELNQNPMEQSEYAGGTVQRRRRMDRKREAEAASSEKQTSSQQNTSKSDDTNGRAERNRRKEASRSAARSGEQGGFSLEDDRANDKAVSFGQKLPSDSSVSEQNASNHQDSDHNDISRHEVRRTNRQKSGTVSRQEVHTTGPIPQQGMRTTGPIPQQGIRTTGPIPQQGMRTTGPIPQQGIRTTGPIPQQEMRTTGPIPQQGIRTTGPIPQQGIRTTGPIPQQGMRITGPVQTVDNQNGISGPEISGYIGHVSGEPYMQSADAEQKTGTNSGNASDLQSHMENSKSTGKPMDGKGNFSLKNNRNRKIQVIVSVIAFLFVLLLVLLLVRNAQSRAAEKALREYVEPYNELYVPGVYVDGIALEGMNTAQAKAMVESQAQQRSEQWSVRLTYNGQQVREITASDLSMTVDVEPVLAQAWAKGHTGSYEERRQEMQSLILAPYEAYTANPSGDTRAIDRILKELSDMVYRAPQDATIASFDASLTYPFTFNDEVIGRKLDTEKLKEEIYHSLSKMEVQDIELTIETTQPSVTVAKIKEEKLALRGSATTPISSSSAAERNENIRTAFGKISGTILQPGTQFSFNNVVGPRTEKNGFLPAIEYAYGELSDGIGGGVCQASTTVYLAAVRAGMEIVKREPHSDAVSYIEYGKDATVYWYSNHKIDMVFKNTTNSPVYITAAVQSSPTRRTNLVCVVNIYGEGMNGVSYDIVTQETQIDAPTEPEYVKDKKAEYVTYTDQQKIVRKASPGCSVDSWRVTYLNGVETERIFMYNDVYNPKPERIYVGVTPR